MIRRGAGPLLLAPGLLGGRACARPPAVPSQPTGWIDVGTVLEPGETAARSHLPCGGFTASVVRKDGS